MREEIYSEFNFKGSHAHSHRRDPLPVYPLSQEIHPDIDLKGAHPEKASAPIRIRGIIRLPRMSGAIRDKTRIGETSASSRSFAVSSSQRGIGDGGFRRKRPEAEREIGCHRFAPENRRSVNRMLILKHAELNLAD